MINKRINDDYLLDVVEDTRNGADKDFGSFHGSRGGLSL